MYLSMFQILKLSHVFRVLKMDKIKSDKVQTMHELALEGDTQVP